MVDSSQFIGMSKKRSQDVAEKLNLIYRLIRIDNEEFHDYPSDIRDDRVCVELEKGVVVKAVIQ